VTLLPAADLARIVRYAVAIGLDPMVMSHGQTFLRDPSYLPELMRAGLRKVSLHVDVTQRGRPGVSRGATEGQLMVVREALAREVRRARRVTRLPLHADHTVTVTDSNLTALPAIVRWTAANADAFSVLGLLPLAPVGRTRERGAPTREAVAAGVAEGLGVSLPSTFEMGHPSCHTQSLVWTVRDREGVRAIPVRRHGSPIDDWFVDQLTALGAVSFDLHGRDRLGQLSALVGIARARPAAPLVAALYSAYRIVDGELDTALRFVRGVMRGEASLRPFAVITHWFMAASDLSTSLGSERLAACTFRVPVGGRLVPMCEMNAGGVRARALSDARERLVRLSLGRSKPGTR
jgi:hypothetical protein